MNHQEFSSHMLEVDSLTGVSVHLALPMQWCSRHVNEYVVLGSNKTLSVVQIIETKVLNNMTKLCSSSVL